MLRFLKLVFLTSAAFFGAAIAAQAEDYLTGYGGYYDVLRHKYPAAQFGGEYRFDPLQFGFRPTLGVSVTTDGQVYGYGGFNWEVPLIRNQLYIIPNFMVGGVANEGSGRNLGGPIEFRSGLEIAYQFDNRDRFGIAFNHTSNADIYKHNSGVEALLINYSVPFSTLMSWTH